MAALSKGLGVLAGLAAGVLILGADARAGSQLRPHESGRYLVDASDTPVYLAADTAWALAWSLTREQVDRYLDHRRLQGFNAVAFLGYPFHHSAGIHQANAYGHRATDGSGNPAMERGGSPDDPKDYWDHVDYIVDALSARGMYALFVPTWGANWVGRADCESRNNPCFLTVAQMEEIGRMLGMRYKTRSNMVWVLGGDTAPIYRGRHRSAGLRGHVRRFLNWMRGNGSAPAAARQDKTAHYRAMAEGILEGVTGVGLRYDGSEPAWDRVLITYHGKGPRNSPSPFRYSSSYWWHDEPWYDIDFIYSGHPRVKGQRPHPRKRIYGMVRAEYERRNPKPIMDSEPTYEGFNPSGKYEVPTRTFLQASAIGGFFAGALAGYCYGHHGIFSFSGYPRDLDAAGGHDFGRFAGFLRRGLGGWSGEWFNLRPDADIVRSDVGGVDIDARKQGMYNLRKPEILVFYPTNTSSDIALERLPGQVIATWWNPSTGKSLDAGRFAGGHTVSFAPPSGWSTGILVLTSQADNTGAPES